MQYLLLPSSMLRSLARSPRRLAPYLEPSLTRCYATDTNGPNQAIVEMLTRNMHEENENPDKNMYKIKAFKSAIKVIQQLDHPIRSIEEAKNIRGIGDGISRRIHEQFFQSGESLPDKEPVRSSAEKLSDDKRRRAIDSLQIVTGVGTIKARNLVTAGCMSIADMRKPEYYDTLTTAQKVGLRFVDQITEPVTREQAEAVLDFIRDNIDTKFESQLGGSYRRGAPTSGDMDVILFHPSHVHIPIPQEPPPGSKTTVSGKANTTKMTKAERLSSMLLNDVVKPLETTGLIAATLSSGVKKWQGVVRIPERDEHGKWGNRSKRVKQVEGNKGVFRRMDLNLVPWSSRGAALLQLTGDIEFNRDIRIKAISMNMHLNEFGLWRWSNGLNGKHDPEADESDKKFWELVKAETEEEILNELGMEYIEPEKRNFSHVVGKKAPRRRKA